MVIPFCITQFSWGCAVYARHKIHEFCFELFVQSLGLSLEPWVEGKCLRQGEEGLSG